jgi:hypothetical protein
MGKGLQEIARTMGGLTVKSGDAVAAYGAHGKPLKGKKKRKAAEASAPDEEPPKPMNEKPYAEAT